MASKRNKKKVVWNNSDCGAATCLRPPGTADWVQCDACSGWFHLTCLELKIDDLKEDRDFYCPLCATLKQKEFEKIKTKLKMSVDELATRQIEFGGVTVDRDFFKDKKNANPYNYSKDFPPTLRDLSSRIQSRHKTMSDFKYDYKEMCKQLTNNLKEEYESRIQIVEWELDDVVNDVFTETLKTDDDTVGNSVEDNIATGDDETFDYQQTDTTTEERDVGGLCQNCNSRFSTASIFSCKRGHKVCHQCRNLISGAVCPRCFNDYGERKRLYIDGTSSMLFRLANAANFDSDTSFDIDTTIPAKRRKSKETPAKRRKSNETPAQPVIMNVWSCSEEHKDEALTMSTVPEEKLSNKILTLINTDILTSPTSPEQQPVNYNDTGPAVEDQPQLVSSDSFVAPSQTPRLWGQHMGASGAASGVQHRLDTQAWAAFREKAKESPRLAQATVSHLNFRPSVGTVYVPDHTQPTFPSQPHRAPLFVPEQAGPQHQAAGSFVDEDNFITPDSFHESVQQLENFIIAEEENKIFQLNPAVDDDCQ